MKTILVPLSLWDTTDVVVGQSAQFADAFRATVHLMHVVPVSGMAASANWPQELRDQKSKEVDRLRQNLQERADGLTRRGLEAHARLVEAEDTADAILEQAQQVNADLIIMGSQERGVLSKALLGDVATDVLRKAACPVVMVPMRLIQRKQKQQAEGGA